MLQDSLQQSSTTPLLHDIPTSTLTNLHSQNQATNCLFLQSLTDPHPLQTSPTILSSRLHRSPSLSTTFMAPTSPNLASRTFYPTWTTFWPITHPRRRGRLPLLPCRGP